MSMGLRSFSRIIKICKKPYDLLGSRRFLYYFVPGMAAFVFLFLWIFEPFGLENLTDDEKFPVISIYAFAALLVSAIQFLLVQPFVFKTYRMCNTFLWILLHVFLIGLLNAFINSFLWNDGYINLYYILYFQGVVLAVGILPIALFITLHYAWLMHKRAEKALAVNTQLAASRSEGGSNQESTIHLKALNGKVAVNCNVDQIIMLKSAENYVEIYYYDKEVLQKELIRCTLSNMEQQLSEFKDFIRCHKSYIVNKQNVEKVSGNAAGYKLHLKTGNLVAPVSRSLNA
ncbi:LytR/AlgR family response regulator transcription factor, partial [Salinivirga cyanobacteriivorans]